MIQAILNKVILKPIIKEEVSEGGIHLAGGGRTPPIGEVISVGEKVTQLKVGQKVMFKKWDEIEVKYEDVMYYVFEFESDKILAIVE